MYVCKGYINDRTVAFADATFQIFWIKKNQSQHFKKLKKKVSMCYNAHTIGE